MVSLEIRGELNGTGAGFSFIWGGLLIFITPPLFHIFLLSSAVYDRRKQAAHYYISGV
jgi:hypothetical protein